MPAAPALRRQLLAYSRENRPRAGRGLTSKENTMSAQPRSSTKLRPDAFAFYRDALAVLQASGVPFLVGGAYAFAYYTGITRHTKDLDVFVRPADARAALRALARGGYRSELTFPHWLGKAHHGDD